MGTAVLEVTGTRRTSHEPSVESGLIDNSSQPPIESDASLALRIRQGDHDAFRALYERYSSAVLGVALSVVRDREAAEDVVHDVFLGFWRSPQSYEPGRGSFPAWLLRVARNRCIDVLRKRRDVNFGSAQQNVEGEAVDPTHWIADPDAGPEIKAVAETVASEVRAALMALPEDHRLLLELAYFGGLTQREIAVRVNKPLGTVKTQMRTSLMRLAQVGTIRNLATSKGRNEFVRNDEGEAGTWDASGTNDSNVTATEPR
jgi:RNA polymerase sigma-70 factor (ECF subfamily)